MVDGLNRRDDVDGILVQMPLPPQVDAKKILDAVDPAKDVDGFHPINVGRLVAGRPTLVACTPAGVMEIFRRSNIPLEGANAVVMGRSDIVGKPMALLLLHASATVTICHSKTRDMKDVSRRADIVVAAMGRAAMITPDYIRPGATVIDVGQNVITDKARGGADFCEFPGKDRVVSRERFGARGRRASGRGECGGGIYARAGRSGSADDCAADEQYGESGADAAWCAGAGRGWREAVMLRVGLTGGIACGKSTVVGNAAGPRLPGARGRSSGARTARAGAGGLRRSGARVRERGTGRRAAKWIAKKLGAIVFADPAKRAKLNWILHPEDS